MEDYKEYNYGDTLRMLDGWYDHDTENVNYAHGNQGVGSPDQNGRGTGDSPSDDWF